jgi:hypothetical protein
MMNPETRTKVMNSLKVFAWSTLGAVIVSFFFLSTFLPSYSPLPLVESGAVFFGPLFCGIILGIILKEFEMPALTASVTILTIMAILFIGTVIVVPVLQTQDAFLILVDMDAPEFIALSAIFIFPISLIGMVIGKALGEIVFLTKREREELKALRKEVREWHEELEKR